MRLRDLDEKVVPAIAEWLDRQLARIPTPPEPSGPAPLVVRLRRVDDRWTRRGPLATLRDIPQLGAVVIGALILAGCVTAKSRITPTPVAVRQPVPTPTTPAVPSSGHLGPQIGDSVTTYLREAQDRLSVLATGQPDGMAVAVISFPSYQTPEQVRDLVGSVQVQRVFFRAPLPLGKTDWHSVPVLDIVRDSRTEFRRVAGIRTRQANELLQVAATIENDPPQKAEHLKDAKLRQREAAILRGTCACVYAVVARTRLGLLLDLAGVPGIRCVDPSPPGALLRDFEYTGLLPEENRVVTGGNQSP